MNHLSVHIKLTQHCKSTILKLKKEKNLPKKKRAYEALRGNICVSELVYTDNLWLEDHRAPLRRAAGREPFGKLLGPAGVGRMIYDPDQLFRKQKLT